MRLHSLFNFLDVATQGRSQRLPVVRGNNGNHCGRNGIFNLRTR